MLVLQFRQRLEVSHYDIEADGVDPRPIIAAIPDPGRAIQVAGCREVAQVAVAKETYPQTPSLSSKRCCSFYQPLDIMVTMPEI
jgi:hypothetical protein